MASSATLEFLLLAPLLLGEGTSLSAAPAGSRLLGVGPHGGSPGYNPLLNGLNGSGLQGGVGVGVCADNVGAAKNHITKARPLAARRFFGFIFGRSGVSSRRRFEKDSGKRKLAEITRETKTFCAVITLLQCEGDGYRFGGRIIVFKSARICEVVKQRD